MTATRKQTIRNDHLRMKILECIEAGLHRTAEISARTGLASVRVASHLAYMRAIGLVNSIRDTDSPRGGVMNIWRAGPTLDLHGKPIHTREPKNRRVNTDRCVIIISKSYPVIGARDPLVAALFGAPRQAGSIASMVTA